MGPYLDIKRIEFIITYRCNSHCKHCLIDAGKRRSKPTAIDIDLATSVINEITGIYSPESIMTFGGEPLLYPEVVCAIHHAAKSRGIDQREVITNAGWPPNEDKFRAIALQLVESGVTQIAVSVDCFHQEQVPIAVVKRNVQALLDAGLSVGWNPCWVVCKEDENIWNKQTKSVLKNLSSLPVEEKYGNVVQPAGNALDWLIDFLPARIQTPEGNCEDVPYAGRLDCVSCISLEPTGDVSVCKEFPIGNARKQHVGDILQDYDPHKIPEMEAILSGGVTELEKFAYQQEVKANAHGYFSICDKCIDLRRRLRTSGKSQDC